MNKIQEALNELGISGILVRKVSDEEYGLFNYDGSPVLVETIDEEGMEIMPVRGTEEWLVAKINERFKDLQ